MPACCFISSSENTVPSPKSRNDLASSPGENLKWLEMCTSGRCCLSAAIIASRVKLESGNTSPLKTPLRELLVLKTAFSSLIAFGKSSKEYAVFRYSMVTPRELPKPTPLQLLLATGVQR